MQTFRLTLAVLCIGVLALPATLHADVPGIIHYQGVLTDAEGTPLSGTFSVTFSIYDVESGGSAIWSESLDVDCEDGLFSVILGSSAPIGLDFSEHYWLGITLSGDSEMSPRYRLATAPYAFWTAVAERAIVSDSSNTVHWDSISGIPSGFADGVDDTTTVTGDPHSLDAADGDPVDVVYVNDDGMVGIETTSPEAKLHVVASPGVPAGRFEISSADNDSAALYAINSGRTRAIQARSDSTTAIFVSDAGAAGLYVKHAGSHGIDVASADGIGVKVYSSNHSGLRVNSAGHDGVRVDYAAWSGVYVAGSGADALRVQTAGQDGLRFFEGITRDYIRAGSDADLDFRVTNDGTAYADGGWQGAADFAELISVIGMPAHYEPGDVLVISDDADRSVCLSNTPGSTRVMGVYSTKPGFVGSEHVMDGRRDDEIPVAIIGIVPCKVSTENGAVARGDLLVTSGTPGHAMRAEDPKPGTVIGKALEPLDSGTGKIRILVTLH